MLVAGIRPVDQMGAVLADNLNDPEVSLGAAEEESLTAEPESSALEATQTTYTTAPLTAEGPGCDDNARHDNETGTETIFFSRACANSRPSFAPDHVRASTPVCESHPDDESAVRGMPTEQSSIWHTEASLAPGPSSFTAGGRSASFALRFTCVAVCRHPRCGGQESSNGSGARRVHGRWVRCAAAKRKRATGGR